MIAFRLFAARILLRAAGIGDAVLPSRVPDHELPTYTILVSLYREAHMLGSLVHALMRLDHPAARLDIKLILEAGDADTIATAHALRLPGCFEIVVVPECQPRTKPKALNYALPLVRGEYVVIYDAEDRPEPGQLRQALHAFRAGPPKSRPGAGEAQSLQRERELAHPPVHRRVLRAVRRSLAGRPAPTFLWAARRTTSAPRPHMAGGMGLVQRHGRRRSRHPARAERLSLPDAWLDPL